MGGVFNKAIASGDPNAVSRINRAMGAGFDLGAAADRAIDDRKQEELLESLEIDELRASIRNKDASTDKIIKDTNSDGTKALTATQAQAFGFGTRLVQSNEVIGELESHFARAPRPSLTIPFTGIDIVPNFIKPESQQRFEQSMRNFINATLRRESGAAISPSEIIEARKQYIPVLGDDKNTLEQKRRNRELQARNFLLEGGQGQLDPRNLRIAPDGTLVEIIQ